ncbi:LSG1-like protein [Mya arenaria]|uniref:Large subunit GTPase 1 homolog n=1 Tax=Mya arenaria TaxID=6604 RepID=A0ABY7EVK2_MYAAR|nr:LSG1-like protein [Mya arenaria]
MYTETAKSTVIAMLSLSDPSFGISIVERSAWNAVVKTNVTFKVARKNQDNETALTVKGIVGDIDITPGVHCPNEAPGIVSVIIRRPGWGFPMSMCGFQSMPASRIMEYTFVIIPAQARLDSFHSIRKLRTSKVTVCSGPFLKIERRDVVAVVRHKAFEVGPEVGFYGAKLFANFSFVASVSNERKTSPVLAVLFRNYAPPFYLQKGGGEDRNFVLNIRMQPELRVELDDVEERMTAVLKENTLLEFKGDVTWSFVWTVDTRYSMGKKKQQSGLGKAIIKDRFGKKPRTVGGETFSVTEQNNLDDFLTTAELAGTEFTAEKLNVKFISQESGGLPRAEEIKTIQGLHKQHEALLRIPRRPSWTSETTASELDQNEKQAFLDWRRSLAMLQEDDRIVMTPYEKNLDFWRQLWRIVDARNPLLFYCADLESYVSEVDQNKVCLLLINKADYLTDKQRYGRYGPSISRNEGSELPSDKQKTTNEAETDISKGSENTKLCMCSDVGNVETEKTVGNTLCGVCSKLRTLQISNTAHMYTGPELLCLFKELHTAEKVTKGQTTVGMVGYPNVGKSSTINAILQMKKVPVSATPGRTKHFQTLFVDSSLMLCDCPGLVFPSFVTTKADLVLCERLPRWMFASTYGIILPTPPEGDDPDRPPTAYEVLNVYGSMRGFMTSNGVPDTPRSSRYLLKDFVNGKLLYCHPPPDMDPVEFNDFESRAPKHLKPSCQEGEDGNQTEKPGFSTVHNKSSRWDGSTGSTPTGSQGSLEGKPWKKHNNRGKKEKLRRVYGYLDKY